MKILCSKNAWRPAAPHLSKALQCLRLQHCNTRFWRGMFHLDQGWHRTNASCHSHVTIFVKSFTQKHVVTTQNGRICWICFHFVTDSHRLRNVHVSTMSTAFNSYIRITSSISPLAPPVLYATPHQGLARHRSQPKTAWCGTAWHSFPQRGRSCYVFSLKFPSCRKASERNNAVTQSHNFQKNCNLPRRKLQFWW